MADELARINLLTDLKATIEASTEDGTPGIATDFGHRLGWLSGGTFRWGALRGGDETFATLKLGNIPAGKVLMTDANGVVNYGSIEDNGNIVRFKANVAMDLLINEGSIVYKGSTGYLASSTVLKEVSGVLSAYGQEVKKKSFACIYMSGEGAVAQSIPAGATYTKITPFDTDLPGSLVSTADAANDRITVGRAGLYIVGFTRTYTVGTANVTWHVAVFVNGVIAQQSVLSVKSASTNTPTYADLDIPVSCAAGDTIDIRIKHDGGAAVDITFEHATLYVASID